MRTVVLGIGIVALAALSAPPARAAGPGSTVTGALTVDGKKFPLVLAYVDESPNDVVVVLASKEVPRDVVPFIGEDVARKLGIHAVLFTVTRAGRALDPQGASGVYCPSSEMGYVGLRVELAKIEVKRLDATGIEARIFTPKPIALSSITYSFDATFSIPLGSAAPAPPPVAVKVSGDASAPSRVYADYYRAVFAGDVKTLASLMAAARRKEFEAADPTRRDMILSLMTSNPPEIKITKATVAGTRATLTVEGLNETAGKSTAEVTMVQEGGAWRVEREKWSTTSK